MQLDIYSRIVTSKSLKIESKFQNEEGTLENAVVKSILKYLVIANRNDPYQKQQNP